MQTVFLKLLDLSLTGSIMILAVVLLRLAFRKAPKWSICLLWALVGLRLICPVSLESPLSLAPEQVSVSQAVISQVVPRDPEISQVPVIPDALSATDTVINNVPEGPATTQSRGPVFLCACIWAVVALGVLLYGLVSFLLLRRRVRTATRLQDNLWQSEFVTTSFVLGFLRPRIYLPYSLSQTQLSHIVAHEQTHIRRCDHLTKPLAYLILAVHWFNPLAWVAYILLCRDIEAACDEKVVKNMTLTQRQSYCATLLRCSSKPAFGTCPVAFGGGNVKARIKGIMNYRKPGFWVILAVLVFGITTGLCFLTEPPTTDPEPTQATVNQENFPRIYELLNEILTDPDCTLEMLTPSRYWNINYDAHRELLSYGEDVVNCFLPHLRQEASYGQKEWLMVFFCADLTEAMPGYYQSPEVWEQPGRWLTRYDKDRVSDEGRLAAGYYSLSYQIYTNAPCSQEVVPSWAKEMYMVTEDCVYYVKDNFSGSGSERREIHWQWETVDNQWSDLITGGPCLYQDLGAGEYLLKSNKNLYLFRTDPTAPEENRLEAVYQMCW